MSEQINHQRRDPQTGPTLADRFTFTATRVGDVVRSLIVIVYWSIAGWAAMALGTKGALLGWFPPVQNAIRRESSRILDQYIKSTS